MNMLRPSRRVPRIAVALAVLLALLPAAGIAATAPRDAGSLIGDISFTLVTTGVLDAGESWGTETTFHVRDLVTEEAVEGDLTGVAIITMGGNFVAAGECDAELCLGNTEAWGSITINDDAGSWDGQIAFQIDDIAETEIGKVLLIGRGGNAGKALYGDMRFLDDEDGAALVTGRVVTQGWPSQGVHFFYDGCFVPPSQTAGHVRMTIGGAYDFGSWLADYPLLIPGAATFGESTVTSPLGSFDSVLMLQNAGSNRIGYFMLLGGDGAYENLIGFGTVRTAAYESAYCDNGAGAGGHWIGRAFAN